MIVAATSHKRRDGDISLSIRWLCALDPSKEITRFGLEPHVVALGRRTENLFVLSGRQDLFDSCDNDIGLLDLHVVAAALGNQPSAPARR